MKKKLAAFFVVAVSVMALASCGTKTVSDSITDQTSVEAKAEGEGLIKLADYTNRTAYAEKIVISDEEVDASLEYFYSEAAKNFDWKKSAEMGDTLVIDFVGEVDGVKFDGGSAEDYSIVLGSNTFFPPFEERMVGMNIGDVWPLDLQFPDDYWSEDLAGKPCIFTVTCKSIVPPISEDNIKTLQSPDYSNMKEFKEYVRREMEEYYKVDYETSVVASVLQQVIDESEFGDIPDNLINAKVLELTDMYLPTAQSYGLDIETFFQYSGTTLNDFAITAIKRDLIFDAIEADGKFSVTDEEIDNYLKENNPDTFASMTLDEFYEQFPRDTYRKPLVINKIYAYIIDNTTVLEPEMNLEGE